MYRARLPYSLGSIRWPSSSRPETIFHLNLPIVQCTIRSFPPRPSCITKKREKWPLEVTARALTTTIRGRKTTSFAHKVPLVSSNPVYLLQIRTACYARSVGPKSASKVCRHAERFSQGAGGSSSGRGNNRIMRNLGGGCAEGKTRVESNHTRGELAYLRPNLL